MVVFFYLQEKSRIIHLNNLSGDMLLFRLLQGFDDSVDSIQLDCGKKIHFTKTFSSQFQAVVDLAKDFRHYRTDPTTMALMFAIVLTDSGFFHLYIYILFTDWSVIYFNIEKIEIVYTNYWTPVLDPKW